MDPFSPSEIKKILDRYGAAPLKSLGQNFLVNAGVLQKIVEASELKKGDVIIEIGPGLGALTRQLVKEARKIIAIEKDKKYAQILKESLAEAENIEIIHGDALDFELPKELSGEKYKLVANLPYNITSPIIRKFLEEKNPPQMMVLMVQKEVARRICASPPEMSLLAVSVQFYAKPEIVDHVSKGNFWPRPKVDSAILKIAPHPHYQNVDISKYFQVVRAGFSAPRKQLASNLAFKFKIKRPTVEELLKKEGIDPRQRAETLSVEEWAKISSSVYRLISSEN